MLALGAVAGPHGASVGSVESFLLSTTSFAWPIAVDCSAHVAEDDLVP